MREYIYDGGPIQAAYEAGDDSTVLELVNKKTEKVLFKKTASRAGYVSNATMGNDLGVDGEALTAEFIGVIEQFIAADSDLKRARMFRGFLERFETTPDGLNFSDGKLRKNIRAILQAFGMEPAPFLALGHTKYSKFFIGETRDLAQADLDNLRIEEAKQVYADSLDQRASNAFALFNDRWQADLTNSGIVWDEAKQKAELLKAWEEVSA